MVKCQEMGLRRLQSALPCVTGHMGVCCMDLSKMHMCNNTLDGVICLFGSSFKPVLPDSKILSRDR